MNGTKHRLIKGLILMASVALFIGLSQRSLDVLRGWEQYPEKVAAAANAAIAQILPEVESYIKANKLSGQSVGVRSGDLRQDLTHEQTDPLGGHVGTTARTAAYAPTILGPDAVTIRPVNSKYLWVAIADNLNPSKVARMTPREAMGLTAPNGKRRMRIFESKAGNLVAFLPDIDADGNTSRFKRNTKGGRTKGQLKGKLLFALEDEVTVQGTDALAEGAQEMSTRSTIIFNTKLQEIEI